MVSIIKKEIDKILKISDKKEDSSTEEKAFNFLVCSLYCYKTLAYEIEDIFRNKNVYSKYFRKIYS